MLFCFASEKYLKGTFHLILWWPPEAEKVAMGKGRNLPPSAVTGGREHLRDTGEHKTLPHSSPLCPELPSGAGSPRKAGSASTLSNSQMSLLKINCLVIIIIKLMCAHCRKCKGGNGRG